ncbi:MAG: acyl-CoA dehydrogenase family protein [Candidatus Hydrogenedentes bacterium]|nr:acyl-CoA dehydrogenase family protein [Candidatus Hydrogenedentota bacterium]
MAVQDPRTIVATHDVVNQARPLEDYNPFASDASLCEGIVREGAAWAEPELMAFGEMTGRPDVIRLGFQANQYPPVLKTHDRFGHRIDEAEFHPAYHELMKIGVAHGVHAGPWRDPRPGAHVARVAKHYLLTQVEAGVGCPLTMTFAVVPALRLQPEVAAEWEPRVTSLEYDPRMVPAPDKTGCLMGMAMTEKQGGSDVRANTTLAVAAGAEGPGQEYRLTGHKWFCSAPMCDAFLTLAQTDRGLSCFIVPRWLPDGARNVFRIQRIKDKLGNRSNASSEIEYFNTYARMVGEDGRGVPTIIEMVNHTRLDCIVGSASIMRQAVAQATHHAQYRKAFGKLLKDQPLMQNVLADLALESEAATAVMLRIARSYDAPAADAREKAFSRIATAVTKYYVTKRAPHMIYEALECHGGPGYVEESIMPRLYREAPLSSIWEGSGNVMCLDVLRAMAKEPDALPAFLDELEAASGKHPDYDAHLAKLKNELTRTSDMERAARRIVEHMALALQASVLLHHAPQAVSETFCRARLAGDHGNEYGTLPTDAPCVTLIERATPLSG